MFGKNDQVLVIVIMGLGLVILFCGGFASFLGGSMTALGGSAFLGLVLIGVGLYSGLQKSAGDSTKYPVQTILDCKVMNILVTNADGQHVFDPGMYDPEELKYFVQLELPGGKKEEYETASVVADAMGEGTRGNAMIQGRWLSGFETTGLANSGRG